MPLTPFSSTTWIIRSVSSILPSRISPVIPWRSLAGQKQPYPWWPQDKFTEYENENSTVRIKEIDALERYITRKDGSSLWVSISVQHIKNRGQVQYYLSNWTDITEHKKAEEQLKEEMTARSRYIDFLAHELKGPLSPIMVSSDMLKELLTASADDILKRLSVNLSTSTKILSGRSRRTIGFSPLFPRSFHSSDRARPDCPVCRKHRFPV